MALWSLMRRGSRKPLLTVSAGVRPRRIVRVHPCSSVFICGSPVFRRLFPEIRFSHARIIEQRLGGTRKGDQAAVQDVAAMARLEREARVLLDEEECDALRGDGTDHLEDLLHHDGCEAHARLVEEEE